MLCAAGSPLSARLDAGAVKDGPASVWVELCRLDVLFRSLLSWCD
jgi:hypothetical protein